MKIQYSDWQNLNLNDFDNSVNDGVIGTNYLEDFLDDSASLNLTSYSNSSLKGSWDGYRFSITGNHFTDNSDTITVKSMSFISSTETLKMTGNLSANYYSEELSGYFSSLYYANSVSNTSFSFSGRLEDTSMSGTSTFAGNGFQVSVTGNFTVTTEGDITSGTVTGFSLVDNAGRRMSVSDISMAYSTFDSLTDSGSNISDLYNALSFSSNDTITGSTASDVLDGAAGADKLVGGKGDDTYIVDLLSNGQLEDTVTEAKNAGIDTLQLRGDVVLASASTIKLAKNVENLDISLTNNSLLNLTGDNAANTLTGNAANNVIDGGKGADTMIGGAGNDTYVLDNAGDIVIEASNGGTDQVNIKFNGSYTLADNVENGFVAHSKAFTLNGNSLNNTLTGGGGKNILDGGEGDDTLTGGKGADTFVFKLADVGSAGAPSNDTITDFSVKLKDVLDLRDLLPSANKNDMTGLLTYIDVSTDGSHTQLHISTSAGFANGFYDATAENATITLSGVNLLAGTSEDALLQNLINKNQLLID